MFESISKLFCSYFGAPRSVYQQDSDGEIYPVHFVDQGGIIRQSIINYTFRYDAVLDNEKLRDSLVQLLEIGDWRKLGGRLRLNEKEKLEIQVPRKFTENRPSIRFSEVHYELEIDQHPMGSRLARDPSDGSLSIQDGCHVFRCFSAPDGLPNNIEHYLTTDEPMIALKITSFTNATLVSLTFPHSLSDVMGTAALLQAWSTVLKGCPEQVPPLLGAREDVLDTVGTCSDEKNRARYVLQKWQIKGLSLVVFAIRFLWDQLTRRNIDIRTIFLPVSFIARLRQEAADEEEPMTSDEPRKPTPFLSDGDLITAWGSRMILASRPRPVIICNVFDLRRRLHSTFGAGAYLQNLILPATVFLPSTDSKSSPPSVGYIARRLRQAIVEQTTDSQARSLLQVTKASYASTGMMPLFGSSDAMIIACTNWSKARLREAANFGPAVVFSHPSQLTDYGGEPGKPVSYWGTTVGTKDHPRDTFVVYGKDAKGNYWVQGYLRPETWDQIERVIADAHGETNFN